MWSLFAKHAPMQEPELSDAMKRRLDELEERQAKVEKAMKALDLDWQEWYDKFRLLYARLAKRIRDAAAEADQDAPKTAEDAPRRTIAPRVARGDPPPAWPPTGTGKTNYR